MLQYCQGAARDFSSLLQSYTTLLLITLIYSDITSDKVLPDLSLYDRRIRFFQTWDLHNSFSEISPFAIQTLASASAVPMSKIGVSSEIDRNERWV